MKVILGCALLFVTFLFGDVLVPPSVLPEKARNFIDVNFKGANIVYLEQDMDSFDAVLSNGVKIEFRIDGNWNEIENFAGINLSFLPDKVVQSIETRFPNISVIKIEREWSGYEFKLANMLHIYVNEDGQIIGQKYDD